MSANLNANVHATGQHKAAHFGLSF